jgi:hypothetical protein
MATASSCDLCARPSASSRRSRAIHRPNVREPTDRRPGENIRKRTTFGRADRSGLLFKHSAIVSLVCWSRPGGWVGDAAWLHEKDRVEIGCGNDVGALKHKQTNPIPTRSPTAGRPRAKPRTHARTIRRWHADIGTHRNGRAARTSHVHAPHARTHARTRTRRLRRIHSCYAGEASAYDKRLSDGRQLVALHAPPVTTSSRAATNRRRKHGRYNHAFVPLPSPIAGAVL